MTCSLTSSAEQCDLTRDPENILIPCFFSLLKYLNIIPKIHAPSRRIFSNPCNIAICRVPGTNRVTRDESSRVSTEIKLKLRFSFTSPFRPQLPAASNIASLSPWSPLRFPAPSDSRAWSGRTNDAEWIPSAPDPRGRSCWTTVPMGRFQQPFSYETSGRR